MADESTLIAELNETSAQIEVQMQQLVEAILKMINQTSGEIKGEIEASLKMITELASTAEKELSSLRNLKSSMDSSPDTSGLEKYEAVLDSVTRATNIAIIAQEVFNLAGKANPVGIIAGAVSLLVEGIAYLVTATDSATEKINNYYEAMEKAEQTAHNTISRSNAEIAILQQKAEIYEELRKQVNRSATEEESLQRVAAELQQVLPNGTALIDEYTGAYNALGGSIENVIAKMKVQARLNSKQAGYEESIAQWDNTLSDYTEYQEKLLIAKAKAERVYNNTWGEGAWRLGVASEEKRAQAIEKDWSVKYYENKVEEIKKSRQDAQKVIDDYEQVLREAYDVGNGTDVIDIELDPGQEMEENFKSTYEYIRKQRTAGLISDEQYYAELEKALYENNVDMLGKYNQYWGELKSYQKSAANALKQEQSASLESLTQKQKQAAEEQVSIWSEASDKIISEYTSALQQITSEQENFQKKMQEIAGGLLSTTENENGESEAALTDYSEKLSKLNEYYSALDKLKSNDMVPDNLMEEIMSMDVDNAMTAMSELQEKSDDGSLEDYIDSYVKFQQQTSDFASSMYADAISDVKTKFIDEYTELINTLPEEMRKSGIDTMKGLVEGILSQKDGAIGQINQLAKDLLKTYKLEMGIESPSKEMKALGSYTTEGLVVGLNEHKDSAENVMQDLLSNVSPEDTVNHFRQSLDSVMSNLSADVSATGVMAGSVAGRASNSVSYVQNNYSPKFLSRAEIYRNTQQMLQLASVRG